jgi:hypothetical protein
MLPRIKTSLLVAMTTAALLPLGVGVSAAADQPTPGGGGHLLTATNRPIEQDQQLLRAAQRGTSAVRALGSNLDEAAAVNDMSVTELKQTLLDDDSAWLSTGGKIFYAEAWDNNVTGRASTPVAEAALFPLASTFTLHSLPGSKHTIYLDFDGYSLPAGTAWDVDVQGMVPGTFDAFDTREAGSQVYSPAFTDDEKAYVQTAWQVVAEKFAPFDVDVTTQAPASTDVLNRTSAADDTWGDRVVFTDDVNARPLACPLPGGCSGIAWRDSFNDNEQFSGPAYYEPTWVYTTYQVGGVNYQQSASEAGETAAHEVGHTFDLAHDGVTGGSAYFNGAGHGNWFPIMGSSVNAVGQWSKGEYTGANNTEDDTAIIASHGAPLKSDDAGDTIGSPTSLGQATSYDLDGVISTRTDKDVYSIARTCTDPLNVTAEGIGEGQSLDIELKIFNAAGTQVASNDPVSGQSGETPTGMDAAAVVSPAAAALYYVQVDGVGRGSAATNGYSDYGSLGGYHLQITGCPTSGAAVPSAPQSPTTSLADRSTTAAITWAAPSNTGTVGGSPATITGYRISGIPAGTTDVSASPRSFAITGLVPGQTYAVKVAALNASGAGPALPISIHAKTWMPTAAPGLTVTVVKNVAQIRYVAPPNPGHAVFSTWRVTIGSQPFNGPASSPGANISNFGNGTYTARFQLFGTADLPSTIPTTTRTFKVGASGPRIGAAVSGKKRGPKTAAIRWAPPASLGGYPITGYRAVAYKLNSKGKVVKSYASGKLRASARTYSGKLPAGRYRFRVAAYNALGVTAYSAYSKVATSR